MDQQFYYASPFSSSTSNVNKGSLFYSHCERYREGRRAAIFISPFLALTLYQKEAFLNALQLPKKPKKKEDT
jgi:hypothetical protein